MEHRHIATMRWLGHGLILLALLYSSWAATNLLGLLQDDLHYLCSRVGGEGGGQWFCADGIGYLLPGVTLLAWFIAAAAVSGVSLFLPSRAISMAARGRLIALSSLVPPAAILTITADASKASRFPSPDDAVRYLAWHDHVFPSAVVFAVAVVPVVAVMLLRGHTRMTAALMLVAAALVCVASLLQPAFLAATILAVAQLALAAGLAILASRTRGICAHSRT